MKKIKVMLLFTCLFMLNIKIIAAKCDNETQIKINTSASNVQANLNFETKIVATDGTEHPEISEEVLEDPESGYAKSNVMYINITNINDNIYLKLSNDEDNISRVIYPSDFVNNTYKYQVPDTSVIRSYFIKVYSNVNDCLNEEIRTIEVKIPMYNYLYGTKLCENNDAYYCAEYINAPIDVDTWELLKQQADGDIVEDTEETKNNNSIYLYISIIGILIVLIVILLIIIRNRHKNISNDMLANKLRLLLFIAILNFGVIPNINAYTLKFNQQGYLNSGNYKTYHSQYVVDGNYNITSYCMSPGKPSSTTYYKLKSVDPTKSLYELALVVGYNKLGNKSFAYTSAVFRLISEYYGELDHNGPYPRNAYPYFLRNKTTTPLHNEYWNRGDGKAAYDIFKNTINAVNSASGRNASQKYRSLLNNETIFNSDNIKFTAKVTKIEDVGSNKKDVTFTISSNDANNLTNVNWNNFTGGTNVRRIVSRNKNKFTVRIDADVESFKMKGSYTTSKDTLDRIEIISPSYYASSYQRMIKINASPKTFNVNIPVEVTPSTKESCVCEEKNGVYTGDYIYTKTENGKTSSKKISKDDKLVQQLECPAKCEVPHYCEIIYDPSGKPTYYAKDGSVTDKQTYKKQCLHICETPDQNEEHVYYCNEKVEDKGGEKCSENEYLDDCYCPPLKEKCEENPDDPACDEYKEKCPNCNASVSIPDSCNDFDTNSSVVGTINDVNQAKTACNDFVNEVKRCVIDGKDQAKNSYEAITELSNNKYCKVWCDESYEFSVPTARYSLSGGYFTLTSQISGTRNCYVSSSANPDKPIDSEQFEEDIKALNQEITEAYNVWLANKNDSNYKTLTDLNDKMKQTITEFNNCSTGWTNDMKFDPVIGFSYHEEEYNKIGTGKFSRSGNVATTITDTYCLGDTNDQYRCLSGALVSDSDNVPNGLYKDLTYVSCDINGCTNNNTLVSQAKWIQKTKTQSATYIPNQSFSTYHQYGTITTGTVCENANITGYNNCLWTRLPDDALPVELRTGKGAFPFKLNFSNIGQSNKDGTLGRLVGNDNSILNKYNELPEESKCGLVQNSTTRKTLDQNVGYVCAYVNNCPECDVSCDGDNCTIEEQCDGVCPVNCKNCIFDGTNTRYKFRTVSLNDLFPNSCENNNNITCRKAGYNWATYKAQEAQKEIEKLGDTVYENPEYSYTLTEHQMANIRRYNKNASTYANAIIPQNEENAGANALQCDQITDSDTGLTYSVRCKSTFLDSTSGEYFTQNVERAKFILWKESDFCSNNNCIISREDGIGPSWK